LPLPLAFVLPELQQMEKEMPSSSNNPVIFAAALVSVSLVSPVRQQAAAAAVPL